MWVLNHWAAAFPTGLYRVHGGGAAGVISLSAEGQGTMHCWLIRWGGVECHAVG